ncbi:nucleotidyltransferase domain-containing protein [Aidingimonas lacisalsi]|uniref:nucleotidyltransferase domain-containing protein n=1 Tax=Aidingimonas lacisalsi TaxID=2604086 RepID=UPI0013755197|nr:nucleotidyltransferase family protein [Aidingimonas lacisalsi]
MQLLLLLSRLEISEDQQGKVQELCAQIDDWPEFIRQAQQRFVLPLVYRNLRRISVQGFPADCISKLRQECLSTVQRNLRIAAAQKKLRCELLVPLNIPHLFFKGPALAARYYGQPGLRSCRDIDLLVSQQHLVSLLEAMLQRDYRPYKPVGMRSDHVSLTFAVHSQPVITVISPEGIAIELHQCIDHNGKIYNTSDLLETAESFSWEVSSLSVMPTAELFVYLCFHHTRHRWSHLHWLADLDATQRHPEFDLLEVRACAARHNLSETVEACLEFYHACSMPEPWRNEELGKHGTALLEACLLNLQGGRDVELALRKDNATPDFAFAWQTTTGHRLACWVRSWTVLWRPSYSDYRSWPLPSGWQWLYWVTRPFRGLIKRLSYNGVPR